jgi:hypothetical protein
MGALGGYGTFMLIKNSKTEKSHIKLIKNNVIHALVKI